jgi:hypothetical protein
MRGPGGNSGPSCFLACPGYPYRMKKRSGLPVSLAIGIAIGVAIGVALNSLAIGIALGVAMGFALGKAFSPKCPAPDK